MLNLLINIFATFRKQPFKEAHDINQPTTTSYTTTELARKLSGATLKKKKQANSLVIGLHIGCI